MTALATLPIPIVDPTAAALARLRTACGRFTELASGPPERALPLLHETAIALHSFATAVTACEQAGLTRAELEPQLQEVRALHGQSPLVHRLQAWPRGYAGDFETVERLCDARNQQARTILATLVANPQARIASLGCGGCRDLSLIQEYVPPSHGRFALVDADADALDFARERLDRLDGRCRFVQGRVPRVLAKLRDPGGFHLIVAGGLFDYLPDRWAVATLTAVRDLLVPSWRCWPKRCARDEAPAASGGRRVPEGYWYIGRFAESADQPRPTR